MNNDKFREIIDGIFDRLNNTLIVKGEEYSRNKDRLHNFNIGAEITNQTRERVLDGFMLKHFISYRDILNDLDAGTLPTKEYIEEKIGDILVYFMLFEASIKEKIENNEQQRERDRESGVTVAVQKGLFKRQ